MYLSAVPQQPPPLFDIITVLYLLSVPLQPPPLFDIITVLYLLAVPQQPPPPTVTLQQFSRRMTGSDTMNSEQLKQIREQQEVSL